MARKPKKKGESGAAVAFISRKQATKRLQLSLKDFRRLCILKGIYPVEPPHKKKVSKGNSTNRTYYHLKDIQFLSHEPIIDKFRQFKVFLRRLKKAIGKKDREAADRIRNNEPIYKLDHIVKERYPTFTDSLRDLDDAISMCFLFATFPKQKVVKVELIQLCHRLIYEFMHYIIHTRSLRKVFISIKGYYYQADIMGETVTWIVPHPFGYSHPSEIDFKIMVTFAQFYTTILGFVNFKLYHSVNLFYPPKLTDTPPSDKVDDDDLATEYVTSLNLSLKTVVKDVGEEEPQLDDFSETENKESLEKLRKEEENIKKLQNLFSGFKFYINREVPRESLTFIIRAFGGEVSWDKTMFVGSTFDESDETITHQIVDRPAISNQYMNRYYVQPQWVYDSINTKILLPVEDYFIGVTLPPHLSPFVEEKEGDYIPPEKQKLLDMQKGITSGPRQLDTDSEDEFSAQEEEDDIGDSGVEEEKDADKDDSVEEAKDRVKVVQPRKRKLNKLEVSVAKKAKMAVKKGNVELKRQSEDQISAEEKRLAILMIPKRKKRLYDRIMYGKRKKSREFESLKAKRKEYEKSEKIKKKMRKLE